MIFAFLCFCGLTLCKQNCTLYTDDSYYPCWLVRGCGYSDYDNNGENGKCGECEMQTSRSCQINEATCTLSGNSCGSNTCKDYGDYMKSVIANISIDACSVYEKDFKELCEESDCVYSNCSCSEKKKISTGAIVVIIIVSIVVAVSVISVIVIAIVLCNRKKKRDALRMRDGNSYLQPVNQEMSQNAYYPPQNQEFPPQNYLPLPRPQTNYMFPFPQQGSNAYYAPPPSTQQYVYAPPQLVEGYRPPPVEGYRPPPQ